MAGAVQCAARAVADARPSPPPSAVHALIFHTRSATLPAHTTYSQITWYEFKRKEGNNHVYERGEPNGQPMAMSTLLSVDRQPSGVFSFAPWDGRKGEYIWSVIMHDKVVKYANRCRSEGGRG